MTSLPDGARPGQELESQEPADAPGWPPAAEAVMARAASENFTVASRVLPHRIRRHLLAVYGYARLVDYAGDEAYGSRDALLDLLEVDLKRVYQGTPRLPLLQALVPTVQECGIPRELLAKLIAANRQDQRVHRYRTFGDLLDYCALSANPIGELVLHVFDRARPDLIELSDQVCTGLQILEHCQDVAEDHRQGRIYLPLEDMERFGCREEDLARPVAGLPLRRLIRFEVGRARRMIEQGSPLIGRLSGLARATVSGYVAGGHATATAFAGADNDPLRNDVRPSKARTLAEWVRVNISGGLW